MRDDDVESEERAIYAIIVIVLAPVVIVAAARHVTFDGGTSLCLLAVVLGAIGLAVTILRRHRRAQLPRARLHGSRARQRQM